MIDVADKDGETLVVVEQDLHVLSFRGGLRAALHSSIALQVDFGIALCRVCL